MWDFPKRDGTHVKALLAAHPEVRCVTLKNRRDAQVLLRRLEGAVPESARQIGGFFAAVEQGIPIPKWFDRDFKGNLPERPEPCLGEAVHQH